MRLKGSYTVEAAVIVSFSFMVFVTAVGLTYSIFSESVQYVAQEETNLDAVKIFRGREEFAEIFRGER